MAWLPLAPPDTRPIGRSHRSAHWFVVSILLSYNCYAQLDDDSASNDESVENPEPVESAQLVTRFEADIEFDRLVEEQNYIQAAEIGARLIELTNEEFGAESIEVGNALIEVAEVQSLSGDYQGSEGSYLRAVEIYQSEEGVYSASLIQPLVGLGDNYQREGEYLNAVSSYNEARSVGRRVFGLLSEEQIAILDRMTTSFMSMGQYAQADQQQLDALTLIERNHEPYSPEGLAGVYKYARWLRSGGRYSEERAHYSRAARLIAEHHGENSALMVKPLREIGNSFRSQGAAVGQGISGLRRALEILEAQEELDRLTIAELLRDIGDWQTAFTRVGTDGTEYQRSWELLEDVPNGEELRKEWYTGIEYVFREPMSQRGLNDGPDSLAGFVLVKFNLDESGQTRDVEVIDSDPSGFKDEAIARHVRQSRFRPRMSNGNVVVAQNLALQVTFRYLPNENEESQD